MSIKRHKLTIPIKPKSKGRPRAGRHGFYTDKATKIYEDRIGQEYIQSEGPFFTGPVKMTVVFFHDKLTIDIEEIAQNSKIRSDVDNLLKAVLDGLNGVAFQDDRQVMNIRRD